MSTVREFYGLACPQCGSDKRIMVQLAIWARLLPYGWEHAGEEEWYLDSPCTCAVCDHTSTVAAFTVDDGGRP